MDENALVHVMAGCLVMLVCYYCVLGIVLLVVRSVLDCFGVLVGILILLLMDLSCEMLGEMLVMAGVGFGLG